VVSITVGLHVGLHVGHVGILHGQFEFEKYPSYSLHWILVYQKLDSWARWRYEV